VFVNGETLLTQTVIAELNNLNVKLGHVRSLIAIKTIAFAIIVAAALALASIILCPVLAAQTQEGLVLSPAHNFAIPKLDGNISFALNGTYAGASLENDTWSFVNMQVSNSLEPENLSVSAINCNVTITSYQTFNRTFVGTFLTYLVAGQGNQTFHLSPLYRGGEWTVTFNGSFIGENEGWAMSPDGSLIVSKAPSGSNVTLAYFVFPDTLGGNGNNSKLPFYQQHSIVISTGIAAAITLAIAAAVTLVSKRKQREGATKGNLR